MDVTKIAIIGGSGLSHFHDLEIHTRRIVKTPYGEPSSPLVLGQLSDTPVFFLPRHGHGHTIAPHNVNYRANLAALKAQGVEKIISVGAVGGINDDYQVGDLVIPDQLIDYTYDRNHTFYDDAQTVVKHIDFTQPYSPELRQILIDTAKSNDIAVHEKGVNAVTQGPRLETAAEIVRLKRDGADVVGMTSMPEAALAKELDMDYALINLVVNPAAGCGDAQEITIDEIMGNLNINMKKVVELINLTIPKL